MLLMAAAPAPATPELSMPGALVVQFFPLIMVIVAFYFLLLRPQQQQQKRRQAMLDQLKRGDKILTLGGLYGEIVAIKDDVLTVRLADKIEVRLNRSGVSQVV